jgi:hypothetical protein
LQSSTILHLADALRDERNAGVSRSRHIVHVTFDPVVALVQSLRTRAPIRGALAGQIEEKKSEEKSITKSKKRLMTVTAAVAVSSREECFQSLA